MCVNLCLPSYGDHRLSLAVPASNRKIEVIFISLPRCRLIKLVIISALVLMACAIACPLVAYVKARRLHGVAISHRRKYVLVYCVAAAAGAIALIVPFEPQFAYRSNFLSGVINALGGTGFCSLVILSLLGPFVALYVKRPLNCAPSILCKRCGYNLTGNTSGKCSECGSIINSEADAMPSIQTMSWGKGLRGFVATYISFILILAILFGYTKITTARYCSECARLETQTRHRFAIPVVGQMLFDIKGERKEAAIPNSLTPFLDPNNDCRHNWVGLGWSGEAITAGWRGIGADPSRAEAIIYEPGFRDFVKDHPDVLDRIRSDLRLRRTIAGWLFDEYLEWKDESGEESNSP